MPESTPPSSSPSTSGKGFPLLARIPTSLPSDQLSPVWRERLERLTKPKVLVSAFLAASAFYCFAIGRDRYTATSEFVIQQAMPLDGGKSSVLSGASSAPSVLVSLLDGQYLQVYLASSDVKNRLFPDGKKFEKDYRPTFPDLRTGLPANSSAPAQLSFYRKQLFVAPQPLTGTVILTTTGFTAEQAFNLNNDLLKQARRFVNEVNQSINADP